MITFLPDNSRDLSVPEYLGACFVGMKGPECRLTVDATSKGRVIDRDRVSGGFVKEVCR